MMTKLTSFLTVLLSLIMFRATAQEALRREIADEIAYSMNHEMINHWYPKAYDTQFGGYLSSFEYDFSVSESQNKMIVSQARHLWTLSKIRERFPQINHYKEGEKMGFEFLRDKFWDSEYGGFHTLLTREGGLPKGSDGEKTAYGNAFGIYGLAAYYKESGNKEALNLAKKAFYWLEEHSYDPKYGGYFQNLHRDGTPIMRTASTPSTSTVGYKDQNSSIHLLEAFTELYQVWNDPLVKKRTEELLILIRDTIVQEQGYLQLFLEEDWTPISFRDQGREVIEEHHAIDHVSYGHDVETAYLMMEASYVLGLENDYKTWDIGKKMVDHALTFGWDEATGGFFDAGYYFPGREAPVTLRDTKNWWAQAEGLNTLLIMADLYPNDPHHYFEKFRKQWDYIKQYLIDHEHGEWYSGGLDKQPDLKLEKKGHIWKTAYHNFRSLNNCERKLRDPSHLALTIGNSDH